MNNTWSPARNSIRASLQAVPAALSLATVAAFALQGWRIRKAARRGRMAQMPSARSNSSPWCQSRVLMLGDSSGLKAQE